MSPAAKTWLIYLAILATCFVVGVVFFGRTGPPGASCETTYDRTPHSDC